VIGQADKDDCGCPASDALRSIEQTGRIWSTAHGAGGANERDEEIAEDREITEVSENRLSDPAAMNYGAPQHNPQLQQQGAPRERGHHERSQTSGKRCPRHDGQQYSTPGPGNRRIDQICVKITKSAVRGAGDAARPDSPCLPPVSAYILNYMVQYTHNRFDASFAALSDVTRRGILEQLGRADASITDLAEKFHMTLTGMKKHVGVLQQAGLVTTRKVGRVRTCRLGVRRLEEEAAWIERFRQLWDARFNELDEVVEDLKRKEKVDGRRKRN
jgi:DNA-binding transcriptional ArsR family regulator